jgi:hypothetical protein
VMLSFNAAKRFLRLHGYRVTRLSSPGESHAFTGQYQVAVGSFNTRDYRTFLLSAEEIKAGATKLKSLDPK